IWGGRLAIEGRGFDIAGAVFLVGGQPATTDTPTVGPNHAEVVLEPPSLGGAVLAAGVQTVALRLPAPTGAPLHLARETGAVPFRRRPTIPLAADAVTPGLPDPAGLSGTIAVALTPPLQAGQNARLLLDRTDPRPAAGTVLAPEIQPGAV